MSNHPDTIYVTDETGAVVPAEISESKARLRPKRAPVVVSAIADHEPWQKHTWTLHFDEPTKPTLPPTDLSSKEEGGSYMLANSLIAIRTGRGKSGSRSGWSVRAVARRTPHR